MYGQATTSLLKLLLKYTNLPKPHNISCSLVRLCCLVGLPRQGQGQSSIRTGARSARVSGAAQIADSSAVKFMHTSAVQFIILCSKTARTH